MLGEPMSRFALVTPTARRPRLMLATLAASFTVGIAGGLAHAWWADSLVIQAAQSVTQLLRTREL